MKINEMTWKDKVWVTGLLLACLFVLYMFTYQAIVNADIAIVDTSKYLIIPEDEYYSNF